MKRNRQFDEFVKNIPQEVKDRVEKAMTCAYYFNGGDCSADKAKIVECNPDKCKNWKYNINLLLK